MLAPTPSMSKASKDRLNVPSPAGTVTGSVVLSPSPSIRTDVGAPAWV